MFFVFGFLFISRQDKYMKILFIPYGTDKAPATRYRVTQYLPNLEKMAIKFKVFSAISGFSTALMIMSPDFGPIRKSLYYLCIFLERVIRFFYIVAISKKFDIIFLQRTTFPFNFEKILHLFNNRIIFDIDDAIYLTDKQDNDIITRIKKYIKEREVINILKVSRIVIVENEYIKDFVSKYCGNVSKIPGPIDTDRFFVKERGKRGEIAIGWIGSPATTPYLHMLDNVFKKIKEKYDFVMFRFIGLGNYDNPHIKFESIRWSYDTEVGELQNLDIGIMPMPDNEWTRGKLGCKMLQYMALGIPAVVSYTPTNAEIIKDSINGFFTTTEEDWIRVLSLLIEDEELRKRVGLKGRETVLEKCSLSRNISRLINALEQ